jgi:hypothetical protein
LPTLKLRVIKVLSQEDYAVAKTTYFLDERLRNFHAIDQW